MKFSSSFVSSFSLFISLLLNHLPTSICNCHLSFCHSFCVYYFSFSSFLLRPLISTSFPYQFLINFLFCVILCAERMNKWTNERTSNRPIGKCNTQCVSYIMIPISWAHIPVIRYITFRMQFTNIIWQSYLQSRDSKNLINPEKKTRRLTSWNGSINILFITKGTVTYICGESYKTFYTRKLRI